MTVNKRILFEMTWRYRIWKFGGNVLRRLRLYSAACGAIWQMRRAKTKLLRWGGAINTALRAMLHMATLPEEEPPHGYDVICLPVIPWKSRFQRPKQMMAQLALQGHRVFYASLRFHGGDDARQSPLGKGIWEIALPGPRGANIYQQLLADADAAAMAEAMNRLRVERRITSAVVVVQLPFWNALAERLRERFGWPIVYDCMDEHAGFSTNCESMLRAEDRTIAEADLVVVTSNVLEQKVRAKARRVALIRNACDYEHFCAPRAPREEIRAPRAPREAPANYPHAEREAPANIPHAEREEYDAPTVGFYGAIAEWFDSDLVADLAELRPGWRFELIGDTFTGDVARLERLPNVALLGEKPYADLPRLTARWDCFVIPFRRIPLTEATNPVKAYEMLATGKPVVAVDLPELRPMASEGLVALADDARGFAVAIERALRENDSEKQERRRAFAARNTWRDRCDALDAAVRGLFPLASILIVTYNNLDLNRACLESVFRDTEYPRFEVIVVDNASTDGTAAWLAEAASREPRLRVILNAENRGFAGGNNQALHAARGEFLCLLNNDTVVAPGWLSTLVRRLETSPRLGMVGPVSNMVGNQAIVKVSYRRMSGMRRWAGHYCRRHDGESVAMDMLGFFCVAMRRDVYEKVGDLDERFGLGYFEDDDYCRRVAAAGYAMCFVRDAFVHHHHGASFKLLGKAAHAEIFERNRQKYEEKWGRWESPLSKERAA